MPDGSRALVWAEWATAAFARAAAEQRPVVLLVDTRWSAPCDQVRRGLLAVADVVRVVTSRFVPVRVDADERPDLAERYTADGWPTLVALTPHGWPLAPIPTGGSLACVSQLTAVADAFEARRDELLRRVPSPPRVAAPGDAGAVGPSAPDAWAPADPVAIVSAWLDDWEAPGGDRRAAVGARAIEVAIDRGERARRPDVVERAVAILDRLATSRLRDEASGLWFRAAPEGVAGWEPVQVLDDQAAWAAVESAALVARPSEARAARLAHLVRGIERSFVGARGYRAARFVLGPADDEVRAAFAESCEFDDRVFVDAQARMGASLMRAGGAARLGAWTSRAIDRLDELVAAAYRRDGGVAHVLDPGPRGRGLLGDQVAVTTALLDAWEVSGRPVYLDAADELLTSTLRKFRDRGIGALRDRIVTTAGAGDVGLLGQVVHPADGNAAAAACLARLAVFRDDPARRDAAHDIVAACLEFADPADPAHAALLATLA